MKELKTVLAVSLIVVLVATSARLVFVLYKSRQLDSQKSARSAELARSAKQPQPATPAIEWVAPSKPPAEKTPVAHETISPPLKTNSPALTSPQSAAPAPREIRQDPVARAALYYVGADPYAEAYWMEAIFDTNLSDGEREDLMEDLNEEGLSNPRRPGPEDVPLILNRIRIIEDVALQADPFMLEHLGEAYKDLLHLLEGQPPQ